MKRLPILPKDDATYRAESGGRVWYQTLEERDGHPSVAEKRAREFEDTPFSEQLEAVPEAQGVDRRTFMTLMGASMALAAGVSGCRRPEEHILPFSKMPEDFVPGRAEYYATALPMFGTAMGLLVKSVDGRPIKIEGNPEHPESLGATTAFAQATVLDLYDPDRSQSPKNNGQDATKEAADALLRDLSRELRAKKGKGLVVLFEEHRSRTTSRATGALIADMPEATLMRFEAFGRENQRAGVRFAFGLRKAENPDEPLREVVYKLENADVIVSLDADLLGTESSPVKNSKAFSKRRRPEMGTMSRLYVAEPSPTVTGHSADHRLRVQARRIPDLLRALAAELTKNGVPVASGVAGAAGKLEEKEQKWVAAAAKDLAGARGKGVIALGLRQHPAAHALCAALNHALGAIDSTVELPLMFDDVDEGVGRLKELSDMLKAGKVETLLILGGNPVFNAPEELGLAEAIKKAKLSIHVAPYFDETGRACTWHIPRAHYLESWSDAVAEDGTMAVIQPLIAPLYNGITDGEVLNRLVGGSSTAYELVMASWGPLLGGGALFERGFRSVLHKGSFGPTTAAAPPKALSLDPQAIVEFAAKIPAPGADFEVLFVPDPHAYDGRFANNAWLMELPDPIHKGTWMTMGAVSAATAKKLGVENGDVVDVTVGAKTISVPVVVSYGHADDSITLPVGLGRKLELSVAKNVGVDVNALRPAANWNMASGSVKKGSGHERLGITQGHFVMEGRPLIRTQTTADYKADPDWASKLVAHPPLLNLFRDWEYKGHKWGMAIDLTLCNGCNACVTACQAENNIPVLGITGVLKSREMHWIRIDRYFAGTEGVVEGADDADAAYMPMLCQHCENAPCEQVCPVAATTHSPEGINEMTYNRCIGTKYCGNNCPFKVRRFNFFNYNKDIPETKKLVLNPDVTVRYRGVMEKCSFCVQRVNGAKIQAKQALDRRKDEKAAYELVAGLQSACMQACPMDAITFGDLNDSTEKTPSGRPSLSAIVSQKPGAPGHRAYAMLEEINVRPRISYLARIQNPNPELTPPKPAGEGHGNKPHEGGGEAKPGAGHGQKESH